MADPRDPRVTVPLLWRNEPAAGGDSSPDPAPAPTRGPRQRSSVDAVVAAGIQLADAGGLEAVTMRRVADRLGLGAMSIYTYVPGKPVLVDLMFDQVVGEVELPPHPPELRARLEGLARRQWDEYRRHPWLLQVDSSRPALGPHITRRWEWQLAALDGFGLTEVDLDQAVTLVVGFVAGPARMLQDAASTREESGMGDLEWWGLAAPALEAVMTSDEFPLSGRVGSSVGAAYEAAVYPELSFEFGLARIIDGIEAYVGSASGPPATDSRGAR
jgi:AcrR family transcriptional regulator